MHDVSLSSFVLLCVWKVSDKASLSFGGTKDNDFPQFPNILSKISFDDAYGLLSVHTLQYGTERKLKFLLSQTVICNTKSFSSWKLKINLLFYYILGL